MIFSVTNQIFLPKIRLALPFSKRKLRILIVGAGVAGKIISVVLREHFEYKVIGFIDDNVQLHHKTLNKIPILGDRHILFKELDRYYVERIVVAISQPIDEELLHILTVCYERGTEVIPMPIFYETLTGKIAVEHIGSQWYSALPLKRSVFNTFNRTVKRCLDIFFGLIIAVLFIIIFPVIAIAIKLDSPGPIFYEQERIGQHGKKFTIYKLRSMVKNAEGDGAAKWSVKGDVRITKVGRFLRRTRLDEFPQILNVLRGEMSIVGPRPERQEFIEVLQQQIPFYRTRLAVKPGITGWAQVNYRYGNTVQDALIKLQYDLYYQKYCSPWLDLQIMFRTVGVVLRMQGQ
jgi:exopolysaccharide biosynthesis polyprenyl glycosylphosphotransferase